MADEAAAFWEAFEKETGEKVLARSMGEVFKPENRGSGVWGLLILTDAAFRFKHMPNDNWLLSLFRRMDRVSEQDKAEDILIRREDILAVESPRKSLMDRLFGPAFTPVTIVCRGAEGEVSHRFTLDPGSGLLPALRQAAGKAEAR